MVWQCLSSRKVLISFSHYFLHLKIDHLNSCALQPLTGKLYTHLSSKYTFLAFLALFEVGSVLCGAAQSSKMLILGRAVAGLGASGLTNGALTIIAAISPLHKRAALFGVMMSVSQIGVVAGPVIGGVLTQYASWRWCKYLLAYIQYIS
jgi:MFS family permease